MIIKDITIYDIAKKLNIAPSTVSRGLKGYSTVSKKTQKKILSTAKAMGYQSNTFAANLRKQRSNTIGVVIPKFNSYFMSDVIAGIEMVTNEAGFNLIISQSLENVEKEIRNLQTMFSSRVDGLLVSLAENTENIDHFNIFFNKGLPVLFFDRVPAENSVPAIVINNEEAGYQATQHLLASGAKRIFHISGNQISSVYSERFKGYLRALNEAGIQFDESLLLIGDLNEATGIKAAANIIQAHADGVFSSNDFCAASCMTELKKRGLRIPEDIKIVGFNNDMISRNVEPSLTTIDYPGISMGEIAARNLVSHLSGQQDLQMMTKIVLRSELIIRNSSHITAQHS